jgi:hypothetical protein
VIIRSRARQHRLPRFLAMLICSALLVGLSLPGTASADDVPALLARVSGLVDRAIASKDGGADALVALALRELDGATFYDQAAWLEEPLKAHPPDLQLAKARIARASEAAAPAVAGPAIPQEPQATLNHVLADSRFHPHTWQDDVPAILLPLALVVVAIANVIWSLIRWPFDRLWDLFVLFANSWAFGPIMAIGAVAVIVGLILLYRRGLRAILVRQAEIGANRDGLPLTAAEALAAARQEEALARYREACHYVLFATLLWIEEKGIARFDRSATNREHLDQLARVAVPGGRVVGALEPVINRFDRVWYGQSFATADDYRDLLALATRVQDSLS